MPVELPHECWQHVISFISPSSRYKNELHTVCKTFLKALKSVALSVSVDVVFHPVSFNSSEGSIDSTTDTEVRGLPLRVIKCLVAPPPNPFRYPQSPHSSSSDQLWRCCDVHCVVEIRPKDLVAFLPPTESKSSSTPNEGLKVSFSKALRDSVQRYLGNASISSCVTKCPDYFPFYTEFDMCAHASRLPKTGVYARRSAAAQHLEERRYISHASLVASSVPSLESMLLPLSGVKSLSVLLDVPSTMKASAFITSRCEPTSLRSLEYLSIGYFDENIVAYSSKNDLSVKFFTSVIKRAHALKHLAIEKVANKEHIAPLLRAALSQNVYTLCVPLHNMNEYLQVISTQEDLLKAMLSSIRSIVISGYSHEVMTVQYLSHLIRFFSHITSLICIIFDMGGEYNDDIEVEEMASIVEAAKVSTADVRAASKLDVFLDFE